MACALHIPGVSAHLWETRHLGGNTAQAWLAHSTFLRFSAPVGNTTPSWSAQAALAPVFAPAMEKSGLITDNQ